MKTVVHKANSRGHAYYGWLDSHFTFSFANYYDASRVHFGSLRVLNDDYIAGGGGFDQHPHDNMEIITIVTEGEIEHKDSMGHTQVIGPGEVQVMTAGTGIFHSEYNKSEDLPVKLLQIWIFPNRKNLSPRYDQKEFDMTKRHNTWQRLVSPDEPGTLMVNQSAWFSMTKLDANKSLSYQLHNPYHGLYIFILEGAAEMNGTLLEQRDGAGISGVAQVEILANKQSHILLMEIPMTA